MTDSPHPEPVPLAFTPVPGRARHDGWTPERQHRFIQALAAIGVVAAAARAVGKSATAAHRLRDRSDAAGLARVWDIAVQMGAGSSVRRRGEPRGQRLRSTAPLRQAARPTGRRCASWNTASRSPCCATPAPPLTPEEQAEVEWLLWGPADSTPIKATAANLNDLRPTGAPQ